MALEPVRRAAARPALVTFVIALVIRAAVALGSFALNPRALIPDELQYLGLARTVASGHSADSWYPGYGQSLYDSTRVFMSGLVVLAKLFAGSRLPAQLYVALVGAAAAAFVVVVSRRFLRPTTALAVGICLALLPSQVIFSATVLREAHVWLALAVVWIAAVELNGDRPHAGARGTAAAVVGLLALGFLRQQTMIAAGSALLVSSVVSPAPDRGHGRASRVGWARRVTVAAALVTTLPWVAGIGLGGWTLIQRGSDSLARTRMELAVGAGSAITPTSVVPSAPMTAPAPTSPASVAPGALGIANRPSASVVMGPDGRAYAIDESAGANLRALPRGLVGSVLRPWPWERGHSLSFTLARVENLGWYVLYALSAVGAVIGLRERRLRAALSFPVTLIGAVVVIAALTQGNVGTAFRHRQQVAAALVVTAAVGAEFLHDRRSRNRRPESA